MVRKIVLMTHIHAETDRQTDRERERERHTHTRTQTHSCLSWLKGIGIKPELIDVDVHAEEKLAHYARACTDVAFKFPFGRSELLGVAARGTVHRHVLLPYAVLYMGMYYCHTRYCSWTCTTTIRGTVHGHVLLLGAVPYMDMYYCWARYYV